MLLRRRVDELDQFVRACLEVVDVEHAFGMTPEEPRHAVLEDLASGTKERCLRIEGAPKRDEIVLVGAGAVQHQQGARAGAFLEAIVEAEHL